MLYFAFCIHNHQPAGNFDFVLEEAYENSYWPFLKTMARHPSIKLTLHNSGYLLDWMVENRPEYIELLSKLVARGQVEVLGGGYYEPVLPVIPDNDRAGQLEMMSERLHRLVGKRPRGVWLTERVWEPTLPSSLSEAGVEYLLVDDNHFIKTGLDREKLGGYYITEDRGRMVKVLPGSEPLRYLIPFKPVSELEAHLRGLPGFLKGGNAAIYGDDGEKFGVWPGTYKWVFTDGWLEGFFKKIEELDFVRPVTLSEYVDSALPVGRVYLPTTSYMEMGEWTLPAEAAEAYYALTKRMKEEPGGDRVLRFVQGGTWRNFFAKYPESNWMHKRMLMVSSALEAAERARPGEKGLREARRHLYKAQCNDAYWHGVFGGLYLPHLREEVYGNLLAAEALMGGHAKGEVEIKSRDVDIDGSDEVVVGTEGLNLFLKPAEGGSLVELYFKPACINLSNTLTRWPEAYHGKLTEKAERGPEEAGTKSIHDMVVSKEEGLHRYLFEDRRRRGSLIDHFLGPGETIEAFKANTHKELGDFALGGYGATCEGKSVNLSRAGVVDGASVRVSKEITPVGPSSFDVAYRIEGAPQNGAVLGVEFNLIFPCCEGPACYYGFDDGAREHIPPEEMGLGSTGETRGLTRVALTDGLTGAMLTMEADRPVTLWRFPVHTVSLSEAGFEKIFQGSCLLFLAPLEEGRNDADALRLTVRAESFLK